MTPEDLLYTKSHEWVAVETDESGSKIATVGVTAFALELLTDLVYIELPEVNQNVVAGQTFGVVESVKAVEDLLSPVDGRIVDVNSAAADEPQKLASDPYGNGWLVKIMIADESALDGLLDHAAYRDQCKETQD